MRPEYWQPPIELSPAEAFVMQWIKRAKLFVFLRQIRHELFDVAFQKELNQIFQDSEVGIAGSHRPTCVNHPDSSLHGGIG